MRNICGFNVIKCEKISNNLEQSVSTRRQLGYSLLNEGMKLLFDRPLSLVKQNLYADKHKQGVALKQQINISLYVDIDDYCT